MRTRGWMRAASLALCLLGAPLIGGATHDEDEVASLVVVTPGIRDGASDQWVGVASQLAPGKDRWVIRQEGVKTHSNGVVEPDPGPLNTIPANHIITIRSGASEDQIRRTIHDITASDHATVIVDMDLNSAGIGWVSETTWAAKVVEAVASEHLREHPKTHTSWIGHSAGTEPMHMVPAGGPGGRPMFDDVYALSPRNPFNDHWPKQTVMLIRDGDWLETPDGYLPMHTYFGVANTAYVTAIAAQGHRVIRQQTEGLDVDVGVTMASGHIISGFFQAAYPDARSHTAETVTATPDQKLIYYAPYATEPVPLGSAPITQGLRTVTKIMESGASTPDQIKAAVVATNPTPGLGGISLSPAAIFPIDAKRVSSASCCEGAGEITLHLISGRNIGLPPMPLDVLRAAYEVAYLRGEKAELSIGGAREENPAGGVVTNLNAPGHSSVYYFGHTRDTLLGLAMYEADSALGAISFGDGPAVAALARRLPGYRSLPELFPEKYADSPAQDRFLGGQRIFLDCAAVTAEISEDGRTLRLGAPQFTIRFGHSGPAEAAYGAFLQSHLEAVAAAPEGRAFAQLVPYAKALAVFRWLKANGVRLEPGVLADLRPHQVFTPMQAAEEPRAKLAEITPHAPTVLFGAFGPLRAIEARGRETRFDYDRGRLVRVRRADGAVFEIIRDGLGAPLAITAGASAAAFYPDPAAGLVLARDVMLFRDGGGVQVRFKPTSTYDPISNPEIQLASLAFRFATGETVL